MDKIVQACGWYRCPLTGRLQLFIVLRPCHDGSLRGVDTHIYSLCHKPQFVVLIDVPQERGSRVIEKRLRLDVVLRRALGIGVGIYHYYKK